MIYTYIYIFILLYRLHTYIHYITLHSYITFIHTYITYIHTLHTYIHIYIYIYNYTDYVYIYMCMFIYKYYIYIDTPMTQKPPGHEFRSRPRLAQGRPQLRSCLLDDLAENWVYFWVIRIRIMVII